MIAPNRIWQFYILDATNNSCTVQDGAVIKVSTPTPLLYAPDGFKNMEIAFNTNEKYFNLARSFSLPLKFIKDGAEIIRYMVNNGRGFEEELYLQVMRWDRETGNYVQEYRGRLDFSKYKDDPKTGVTVNAIEGGILQYLNSNEGTDYDILCDETAPDIVQIDFTGINLKNTNTFQQIDIGQQQIGDGTASEGSGGATNHIIPLVFVSHEGDSVGLVMGNPNYDHIGTSNLKDNSNYLLETTKKAVTVRIQGNVYINIKSAYPVGINLINCPGTYYIYFVVYDESTDTLGTPGQLAMMAYPDRRTAGTIKIDSLITIDPKSKLFIYGWMDTTPTATSVFSFGDQELKVTTNTVNDDTTNYALKPLALLKALVSKMTDGKYTAESNFFTQNANLLTLCGDSIRNTAKGGIHPLKNYLVTTSFADFFASYNSIYNLGIKIENNVLWIEPKADLYGDDGQVLDIGEVKELEIATADNYIANVVKCGYPAQDYDQNSGKYEFNSERSYSLPVTVVKKDYDITSKYRGDAFGIEFIRGGLAGLDNTDNSGDKQAFLVDTMQSTKTETITATVSFLLLPNGIGFHDLTLKSKFRIGDTLVISGTTGNNYTATVIGFLGGGASFFDFYVQISTTATLEDDVEATIQITGPRTVVKRPAYDTIEGVLDNTVYNTTISPKRQLLAHGNYLHGMLRQQEGQSINFLTGDKNTGLITTLGTEVVNEAGAVTVESLAASLFLPYQVTFKSKVPYRFVDVMSTAGKGYIKMTYKGFELYCLPIGTMKAKPVISSEQEWTLLVAPKTDLSTLFQLSGNGQFFFNMDNALYITDLNPLHFVKYDYQVPPKYHETGMYNAWLSERITRWTMAAKYIQPWQQGDTIELQFMSNSNSNIVIKVYSCIAGLVKEVVMTEALNIAVQAPNRLLQASINTDDLEEDNYMAVVYSDGKPISISEPFSVSEDCPNTFLFEYKNSYNFINAFFDGWNPSIRIEAFWSRITPSSTLEDYQNEEGSFEILSGQPTYTRKLFLGSAYGLPDWMLIKLNQLLLVNVLFIDGQQFTRNADSKLQAHEQEGNPLSYFDIDMSPVVDPGLQIPKSQISTMIYYGSLSTAADPTISDKFFLADPSGDLIIDFGPLGPSYPWFWIPAGYGIKTTWQDLGQPLIAGTINQSGDLFKSKDFTINGKPGTLYKAQWITQFNNNPTSRIKVK